MYHVPMTDVPCTCVCIALITHFQPAKKLGLRRPGDGFGFERPAAACVPGGSAACAWARWMKRMVLATVRSDSFLASPSTNTAHPARAERASGEARSARRGWGTRLTIPAGAPLVPRVHRVGAAIQFGSRVQPHDRGSLTGCDHEFVGAARSPINFTTDLTTFGLLLFVVDL